MQHASECSEGTKEICQIHSNCADDDIVSSFQHEHENEEVLTGCLSKTLKLVDVGIQQNC